VPKILLHVVCPWCGFEGNPLAGMVTDGESADAESVGGMICNSCDYSFNVTADDVHDAQHACLIALGEA
jgi:hypothetical protein